MAKDNTRANVEHISITSHFAVGQTKPLAVSGRATVKMHPAQLRAFEIELAVSGEARALLARLCSLLVDEARKKLAAEFKPDAAAKVYTLLCGACEISTAVTIPPDTNPFEAGRIINRAHAAASQGCAAQVMGGDFSLEPAPGPQ